MAVEDKDWVMSWFRGHGSGELRGGWIECV